MAYGGFKDLNRRIVANKVLLDNAFNMARNLKYDGYQRGVASMVYRFLDKISASLADKSASGRGIKNESMSNKELAEELHKPIIRNF